MSNSNLPVVQKQLLPTNIKNGLSKAGKIAGFGSLSGGLLIAYMASFAISPLLVLPTAAGFLYSTQQLLNQTLYHSHKDIAFITKRRGSTEKIYQDVLRPDISLKLQGMSEVDKAAFLQLQAIIGLSKLHRFDKNGNPMQFETDSHSVVQKTFRKLESIGLLKNYSETPKKQLLNKNKQMYSHLLLPKLAFGNIGGIKKKVPIYNIKFQLGEKRIDIHDPNLIRAFPMIFSSRAGLLSRYNYNIIQNTDSTLSIDYHADKPFIEKTVSRNSHHDFVQTLKNNRGLSLEQQQEFSTNSQLNHLFTSKSEIQNKTDKVQEDEKSI